MAVEASSCAAHYRHNTVSFAQHDSRSTNGLGQNLDVRPQNSIYRVSAITVMQLQGLACLVFWMASHSGDS
jgi:hypothetical protein